MEQFNGFLSDINQVQKNIWTAVTSVGYVTGVILGIIGITLLIYELYQYYYVHKINRWPITKNGGTILGNYMEETTNNITYNAILYSQTFNQLYYRTRVAFKYTVGADTYISNQLSYYEGWYTNPIIAKYQSILYAPGSNVDIRINPKNPAEAYILNEPYTYYYIVFFAVALLIIGIYTFYKSLKNNI